MDDLDGPNVIKGAFIRGKQEDQRGFPGGSVGQESACQCRSPRRCRFDPWVRKISWRRRWKPFPVFLPGESRDQRSLLSYSPWGPKESDMTENSRRIRVREGDVTTEAESAGVERCYTVWFKDGGRDHKPRSVAGGWGAPDAGKGENGFFLECQKGRTSLVALSLGLCASTAEGPRLPSLAGGGGFGGD